LLILQLYMLTNNKDRCDSDNMTENKDKPALHNMT